LLRNFAFFHKDALSLGIRAEISNDNYIFVISVKFCIR
jgi:hypothetical protein